jgi:hypothetical protein
VFIAARVLAANREYEVRVDTGPAASVSTFLMFGQGSDLESADAVVGIAIPVGTRIRSANRARGQDFVLLTSEFSDEEIRDGLLLEPENALRTYSLHVGAVVESVVVPGRTDRGIKKINKDPRYLGHVRIPPSADAARYATITRASRSSNARRKTIWVDCRVSVTPSGPDLYQR